MKKSKAKKYIIMLAIGFIFLALDVPIYTNLSYPNEYSNSNQIIGEFQYYTLASTYGARCTYKMIDSGNVDEKYESVTQTDANAKVSSSSGQTIKVIDKVFFKNIRIDIFNDFAAFILIGFACFKLGIVNQKFRFASLCALCGFILNGILALLPFLFNGMLLCNITLVVGIAYLACSLLTIFLFVNGLLGMCRDVCCRDERKWCKTCWFLSFTLQILVTFVLWLGSDFKMLHNLGLVLEACLVLDIILFWSILRRTYDYIEASYRKAIEKNNNNLITEKS
ncbi:MAG: hypothetical protein ACLRZ9_00755 [Eubacterium sp.]